MLAAEGFGGELEVGRVRVGGESGDWKPGHGCEQEA